MVGDDHRVVAGRPCLEGQGDLGAVPSRAGGGGLAHAIVSNRKATTAGFVILALFCFLAAFPELIARSDNPQAEIYDPTLGPSHAHLLGTTVRPGPVAHAASRRQSSTRPCTAHSRSATSALQPPRAPRCSRPAR